MVAMVSVPWRVWLRQGWAYPVLFLLVLTNGLLGKQLFTSTMAQTLPNPPSSFLLRLATLNEPVAAAYGSSLYVQLSDVLLRTEPRELVYDDVLKWLRLSRELNPDSGYPLFLASRFFGGLGTLSDRRKMLDFVYNEYRKHPGRDWRWMAHAVFVARHELNDLPLALEYAKALKEQPIEVEIPHWARQMHVFIQIDLGELEAAKVFLGQMLESKAFAHPQDFLFFQQRLKEIEQRQKATQK